MSDIIDLRKSNENHRHPRNVEDYVEEYERPWTITQNTWYHLAVVRSGNALKVFLNGTQVGQDHNVQGKDIQGLTSGVTVGSRFGSYSFNGLIDEIRISQGIARWTSDFSVPSAPYGEALSSASYEEPVIQKKETDPDKKTDPVSSGAASKGEYRGFTLYDVPGYAEMQEAKNAERKILSYPLKESGALFKKPSES